jgi:hypothetical protein
MDIDQEPWTMTVLDKSLLETVEQQGVQVLGQDHGAGFTKKLVCKMKRDMLSNGYCLSCFKIWKMPLLTTSEIFYLYPFLPLQ